MAVTSSNDSTGAETDGHRAESRAAAFVHTWGRVTDALGSATTPEGVIDVVVQEAIRELGADAGSVFLPAEDGLSLEIRGSTGYDERRLDGWQRLPLSRHTPTTDAFLHRRPVFLETVEDAVRAYPCLGTVLSGVTGSLVSLPLTVRDDILGTLALTFSQERTFDDLDRTFLTSLAGGCAQALQRSAALAASEQLNDRLTFLADVSGVLSTSLDLDRTLASVARLTVPRLADWCVIYLPVEGGPLEPVTVMHQDPAMVEFLLDFTRRYPTHTTPDSGIGRVYLTGEPELVPTIPDEAYDQLPTENGYRDDVRRLQLRTVLTVPMKAAGHVVGVLGMARSSLDRAYTEDDLAFALQVAGRAGKAVENARLHRSLDALNAHLEERVQQRTEALVAANRDLQAFAHSASHDLRTPIRHIASFAELLARRLPVEDERSRSALTQIETAARRLSDTVDGLLMLSTSGQQPLSVVAVDLDALTHTITAELSADHPGRVIEWVVRPLPTVLGDASLLTLVLQNLLGNAVKYTRECTPAVITVEAATSADEVAVTVRDNGVGFDPDYAHKLFVPFARLHSPDSFAGTGLGLANVRRMVERHGGRVWAHSGGGTGALFGFTLPVVAQR
ncbi:signal transduction histidine kinase [Deinococcus metalli]|uniref:histidine kinase n=1 Tax=Deinococcus metalli TaxID=1141878 RepID=A0A7W8KEG3_9DEIO|nr:GAF domain-containing protein [Deinococcus metalli]MBB5376425.1 signal transduction histidine kinase [Deinococcus metalli]GHF44145.1 hypothetical protein GCM10017781_20780 [Deinococcus metalli]